MSNNPSFINFKDKIGTKCNFLMYSNPSISNWNTSLNDNFSPIILKENWTNINGYVYQLSSKNELVLIRKRKAEIQEKNASINEKQTLNDKGALHTFNRLRDSPRTTTSRPMA
ncbi:hypothetical protein N9Y89_02415 [bacterium]|nr:hypothetical protein [bacterium]